jgi:DNA repair exonuclease SbcCD nuclease subunit
MILFTADWHIKLGQKNVPEQWAYTRYALFYEQVHALEDKVDLHIIGGDLFDRLPNMAELELYFEFVKGVTVNTIIYDGNHEATKKHKTFFDQLKSVTHSLNPKVKVITESYVDPEYGFGILPYTDLHKKGSVESFYDDTQVLFTHVRGEIPPHVKPEVDLDRFDKFKYVYTGDLHSHSNTQRNLIYPGSPMTTSFHRNEVTTGYLLIDPTTWGWTWHEFELPQLIRKTIADPADMLETTYHHTIYEIEGDIQELSQIQNSALLDKKVVKRSTEASLVLAKEATIEEELVEYLSYILELDEERIPKIIGTFNDYASKVEME